MKSTNKLVLVTGASGYVAGHVVQQLLDGGYRVRGTARGGKVDFLREFWKDRPNFEVVQLDDVATSDCSDALEGVDAVIHLAWPFGGQSDPGAKIKNAINGTLNILRQGAAKGIKKFVITSSWVTVLDPTMKQLYQGLTFTEKNWGKASYEDLLVPGRGFIEIYTGAKILSEQAAWQFSDEHPELDIATTSDNSTGAPGRPLPSQLLPFHVDVRDLALAHIRALELPSPLLPPAGEDRQQNLQRRFLVVSPDAVTWDVAVKHLWDTRPALRGRLPTLENLGAPGPAPTLPGPLSKNDTTRAREVLGLTAYIGWQTTFDDTIDALLEAEAHWA